MSSVSVLSGGAYKSFHSVAGWGPDRAADSTSTHRALCVPAMGINSGMASRHFAVTNAQRGANEQPGGRRVILGGAPGSCGDVR